MCVICIIYSKTKIGLAELSLGGRDKRRCAFVGLKFVVVSRVMSKFITIHCPAWDSLQYHGTCRGIH